jgi:hypothetical protein
MRPLGPVLKRDASRPCLQLNNVAFRIGNVAPGDATDGRGKGHDFADRTAAGSQYFRARVGHRWNGKGNVTQSRPINRWCRTVRKLRVIENLERWTVCSTPRQAKVYTPQRSTGNTRPASSPGPEYSRSGGTSTQPKTER